jgi:Na+(H+)/acetate symporter ActP
MKRKGNKKENANLKVKQLTLIKSVLAVMAGSAALRSVLPAFFVTHASSARRESFPKLEG